jgi:hypothetical protein
VILEAVAYFRNLVIAIQESLQVEEIPCFVNGPVQEKKLLFIGAMLERMHPLNVALSFIGKLFHIRVSTSTDEADQGFHFVTFACFAEGLHGPAVN